MCKEGGGGRQSVKSGIRKSLSRYENHTIFLEKFCGYIREKCAPLAFSQAGATIKTGDKAGFSPLQRRVFIAAQCGVFGMQRWLIASVFALLAFLAAPARAEDAAAPAPSSSAGAIPGAEPETWRERYHAQKWKKEQNRPYTHHRRQSGTPRHGGAWQETTVLGSTIHHNRAPAEAVHHEDAPAESPAHQSVHHPAHPEKSHKEKASGEKPPGGSHGKH
jgi:hypothetical protein